MGVVRKQQGRTGVRRPNPIVPRLVQARSSVGLKGPVTGSPVEVSGARRAIHATRDRPLELMRTVLAHISGVEVQPSRGQSAPPKPSSSMPRHAYTVDDAQRDMAATSRNGVDPDPATSSDHTLLLVLAGVGIGGLFPRDTDAVDRRIFRHEEAISDSGPRIHLLQSQAVIAKPRETTALMGVGRPRIVEAAAV